MGNIEYIKIIENLTSINEEIDDKKINEIIEKIINKITLLNNNLFGNCNSEEEYEHKLKLHTMMIIKEEIFKNCITIADLYPKHLKNFARIALNDMESKVLELFYLHFLSGNDGKNIDVNEIYKKMGISEIQYLQHCLALSLKQAVYFKNTKVNILTRKIDVDKK